MNETADTQLGRHLEAVARKRKAIRRITLRCVGYASVALVAAIIYLQQIGLPGPLEDYVLARVNAHNTYLKLRKFKLDILSGGIRAEEPKVFRKRSLGAPYIEAESIVYKVSLLRWIAGEPALTGVHIEKGVFRKPIGKRSAKRVYPSRVLTGALTLSNCDVEGLWVNQLSANYTIDGPELILRTIRGDVGKGDGRGSVSGTVMRNDKENQIEGRLKTTMDPNLVTPVLEGRKAFIASRVINRFRFTAAPPEMETDFEFTWGDNPELTLTSQIKAKDCVYNDVPAEAMEAALTLSLSKELSSLSVSSLKIQQRAGQKATVEFMQNFRSKSVYFNATSTMDPKAILGMINTNATHILKNISFSGPTVASADGIVHYGNPDRNNYTVRVADANVKFLDLQSSRCSFDVDVRGRTNSIERIRGEFYKGNLAGTIKLVQHSDPAKSTYATLLTARDVDFTRMMNSVTRRRRSGYDGTFSGSLNITGLLSDENMSSMKGTAKVRIKDTQTYKMPILGDLSNTLVKIIPGLDFLHSRTDLIAPLEIGDRKIKTDNTLSEGNVLSLQAKGTYDFDQDIDFKVKIRLMKSHTVVGKGLNFILLPVSQLLEFKLEGTADEPTWRPVYLPKELTTLLSDDPDGTSSKTE